MKEEALRPLLHISESPLQDLVSEFFIHSFLNPIINSPCPPSLRTFAPVLFVLRPLILSDVTNALSTLTIRRFELDFSWLPIRLLSDSFTSVALFSSLGSFSLLAALDLPSFGHWVGVWSDRFRVYPARPCNAPVCHDLKQNKIPGQFRINNVASTWAENEKKKYK